MENKEKRARSMILLGIVLNIVALGLYNVFSRMKQSEEVLLFTIFLISAAYFIIIEIANAVENKWRIFKLDARQFFLLLSLLTISCFSVNLEVIVFAKMPDWLIATFFVSYAALGLQIYFPKMPKNLQTVNLFFMGIAIMLAAYFTIYLMPLLPIGFLGLIFFGLTIHLLVPMILLITLIVHIIRAEKTKFSIASLILGLLIPVFILIGFTSRYASAKDKIHRANASIVTRPDNDLSIWVLLSQKLDDDPVTRTLIEGDLVYDMGFSGNWFSPQFGSFGEAKLHNPFVSISNGLTQKLDISTEDRINILRTLFGQRHKAMAKLWTGKDLATAEVLTNIRVYPEYRMAYMEKIISVKNKNRYDWNQQEALYSFTLPEGSVASSLSLWINGKEEKSRLSTKAKADSAYTTIVGVEVRDPSVMHWQEGNRLVVNVFPCTPQENRRFKIGVSIPLEYKNNTLSLKNVEFEGPITENTLETTVLKFETEKDIQNLEIPSVFDEMNVNEFQYTGNYLENWEITFNSPKLSSNSFAFGGNTYKISELDYKNRNIQAKNIFLDINKSWTEEEFNTVLELFKGLDLYVYNDKIIKLSEKNREMLFEQLSSLNFSLFPIHLVGTKSPLIISKSTENSPNYSELKDSEFIGKVSKYLSENKSEKYVFNFGESLSPYLKTLKQFRVINYRQGNLDDLQKLRESGRFPVTKLDSNQVAVPVSNTKITKIPGETNSGAPDHIMRLYAYNKTVQQAGRHFFKEDYITEKLISLAEDAYIVSPVSSLIVLESQKDYERFDIDENKNSLGNATAQGHGGVPEPHEWALIIISALVVLIISCKKIF